MLSFFNISVVAFTNKFRTVTFFQGAAYLERVGWLCSDESYVICKAIYMFLYVSGSDYIYCHYLYNYYLLLLLLIAWCLSIRLWLRLNGLLLERDYIFIKPLFGNLNYVYSRKPFDCWNKNPKEMFINFIGIIKPDFGNKIPDIWNDLKRKAERKIFGTINTFGTILWKQQE